MKRIVCTVAGLTAMIGVASQYRGISEPTSQSVFPVCEPGHAGHRPVDLTAFLTPSGGGIPLTGNAARLLPAGWLTEVAMQRIPTTAACFAEGTSPELVDYYNQILYGNAGNLAYFTATRWGGAQGTPLNLTWSFVPDGLSISSGIGEPIAASEVFARLDALFAGSGGRAAWISLFEQCFARWSELTGLTYTRVTVGGNDWDDGGAWGNAGFPGFRGDVRISMKNIDGGFNVLAYNNFPTSGGDMVLDRSEAWAGSTNNFRFMRNIIMHEHGHGIGLFHVCPAVGAFTAGSKLMEPFLHENFDGLRHDDVRGGQRHYGDPFEEDNDVASANDLGILAIGTPINVGAVPGVTIANTTILSLDADSEQDFFLFTTTEDSTATATVTPRGLNYDSSPQSGGSCTSGNFVNSLATQDLNVEILDTDGVAVLGTGAANPAGSVETASAVSIPAGSYYVRIYETGTSLQSQLYELTVSAQSPTPLPAAADPDAILRNRYISFVPNNPGQSVAFRVNKTTSPVGACYAGPPDSQGNSQCLPLPTFRVWSEPVVTVGDCMISPVANFEVRSTFEDVAFAAPLALQTINLPSSNNKLWGDLAGINNGSVWTPPNLFTNVNDILAVLAYISGAAIAPDFERANLQAVSSNDPCLNAVVNAADVFILVRAVIGDPYPFTTDPLSCPLCSPLP